MNATQFADIPTGLTGYERCNAVILPVPYEHTTCHVKGTTAGPQAILNASQEIELFDEKLGREVYQDMRLYTAPFVKIDCHSQPFLAKLEAIVAEHLENNKLVVTLGGEHTVTIAAVRAYTRKYSHMAVLQIDAHADLRDSYQGDPYSHACTMRRVLDHAPLYQVGIRSLTKEEFSLIESGAVSTLFSHNLSRQAINHFVAALPEELYITIDMDGFDPAVVPGVGTPEPGGLTWDLADYLLDLISQQCSIRGFDVVELRPLPGEVRSEVTAARLIYRILGYMARRRNQ